MPAQLPGYIYDESKRRYFKESSRFAAGRSIAAAPPTDSIARQSKRVKRAGKRAQSSTAQRANARTADTARQLWLWPARVHAGAARSRRSISNLCNTACFVNPRTTAVTSALQLSQALLPINRSRRNAS